MNGKNRFKSLFMGLNLLLAFHSSGRAAFLPDDLPFPHPSAPPIERVTIPAGQFLMGTDQSAEADEAPQHSVYTNEFEISVFEITWGQYQAFIEAGGYENKKDNGFWTRKGILLADLPAWTSSAGSGQKLTGPQWSPSGPGPAGWSDRERWPPRSNDPVIGVSYWEAEAFARFVGGRLPTEAEWEKAASWGPEATAPRVYPWGDNATPPLPANGFEVSEGFSRIEAVDDPRYAGDVSRYGVRGMGGNVNEWVADMYDPEFYHQGPELGLRWENPFNKMAKRLDDLEEPGRHTPANWVIRGGHFRWNTADSKPFACARREYDTAVGRGLSLGFRVVWDKRAPEPPWAVPRTDRPGAAVAVPAGTYRMGHASDVPADLGYRPDESPQHGVCLAPYWIGKYEVTWYEYKKFIEMGGYQDRRWWSQEGWKWRSSPPGSGGLPELQVNKPDIFGEPRPLIGYDRLMLWKGPWLNVGELSSPPDDHPVFGLSWYEAEAYCRFVGGRFPTEAEWEVAATWNPQTGRPQQFTFGNIFTFTHEMALGNTGDDPKYCGVQTSPVGMYPEGRSPFGCYDMMGNVFEWVQDWYHPESYRNHPSGCGQPVVNPDWLRIEAPHAPGTDPVPTFKVNRGGGFDPSFDGTYSQRARTRGTDGVQIFRNYTFGFRVAWDQDPENVQDAQRVRPPYVNGTDQPDREAADDPPTPPSPDTTRVYPTAETSSFSGVIDSPGKEDWYRISGPAGALVQIDVDANGGADDENGASLLDAAVEIWHPGIDLPVLVRDDEVVDTGDVNLHLVYLDPPVLQHRIPAEGSFWVKVRAYYWPAEGSQAGLSKGERSYNGPEYTYSVFFRAPAVAVNNPDEGDDFSSDLNGDGRVDSRDLVWLLHGVRSKTSKRILSDLNGDGAFNYMDVFVLPRVWADYGKSMKKN